MQVLHTHLQNSNILLFFVVYLSFFLDNVLLTVVVPIIPDYLFSNELNDSDWGSTHPGPKSLSPLQQKYEALENDNGPLGALLASKAFVQLAFTPLMGYLTESTGCYLPLLFGSCNMLLAALLFAYGNSYGLLVLARALHGSSSAAIAISGMSILAKNVPINLRTKVMPIAFGGTALGVLIGYPLGGAVYQFMGKKAPFLLIASFIVISIVIQIFFIAENNDISETHSKITYVQWMSFFKDKQILLATTTICICTSTMAILEPCVPIWLIANMKPPPSRWQLGAVFIPDSIGYFIGSHFAGLLPVDFWRIALSALLLAGLSCYGLPFSSTLSELAMPHFGIGLSVGAVDAVMIPYLANLVDGRGSTQYGPVYALQQMFVSLAYSFGPLLGGEAVHILGFPWLIRIVGFVNILFCPLLVEFESAPDKNVKDSTSYSTLESEGDLGPD